MILATILTILTQTRPWNTVEHVLCINFLKGMYIYQCLHFYLVHSLVFTHSADRGGLAEINSRLFDAIGKSLLLKETPIVFSFFLPFKGILCQMTALLEAM